MQSNTYFFFSLISALQIISSNESMHVHFSPRIHSATLLCSVFILRTTSLRMGFLLYFPVCPSGDLNKYVCVFQVKNKSYFGWAEWNFKSAARNDLSCFADRKMALALPLLSFLKTLNWRQLLFILLKFISLIPRSRRLNIFIS